MQMKLCLGVLAAWMLPADVWAQACRTEVRPDRGNTLQTDVLVPSSIVGPAAGTLAYPIALSFPPGATRVGLEMWTHRVPAEVPAGAIHLRGYIDRRPWAEGQLHNAVLVHAFQNDGSGRWVTQNLSTVLNANEWYIVGIWNATPDDIVLDLTVTVLICGP